MPSITSGMAGAIGLLVASFVVAPASAQTVVGMGTAQQGATVQYGAAIAKVVSERSGLQMRTQALSSTNQYAPRVNAGELEFGLSNMIEANFALKGTGFFEGRPNPNLRMAFTMFPLPITFMVSNKSGIKSAENYGGARAPVGWNAQKLGDYIFRGFFANQNAKYESVRGVPVTAMPRMWDLFGQGELDLIFGILNGATTKELAIKVGGARYISVDDSPEAIARMQPFLPGSYVTNDKNLENGEMVKNIAFDFVVFTNASVSDDTVYRVVKAAYEGRRDLKSYSGDWLPRFVGKTELEYHPGAIKLYKEVGLWPPKQ